jgi:hypothetical protein
LLAIQPVVNQLEIQQREAERINVRNGEVFFRKKGGDDSYC